jgi:Leucine-rich repeat (LRR) protein
MKQLKIKSFLAIFGLIMFVNIMATAQTVNMNRYIELTVQQGQQIRLNLNADIANTDVKVVSGTSETTLTVGTSWTGFNDYFAQTETMRVYGNVKGFDCRNNTTKITELDVSNNAALITLYCINNSLSSLNLTGLAALTYLDCSSNSLSSLNLTELAALTNLYCNNNSLNSLNLTGCAALTILSCHNNNFTTQALDEIYCALPVRQASDNARIFPVSSTSSTNHSIVLATNKQNAISKNWKVQYPIEGADIPATTGDFDCNSSIKEVMINGISAKVYPNPVSNDLNIECGEKIESLDIYDALGRRVISKQNTPKSTTIDVSNLDNGIYILKLRTAKGSGEYKVVVKQ